MKFGYCVNMIAQDNHGIGYEQLPMLKRVGFDYVELPLAQIMTMGDRAFRTARWRRWTAQDFPVWPAIIFSPRPII